MNFSIAAKKAARLYFGSDDSLPVKQHMKTLIPTLPIGKLILMCNDIDCVTRRIFELNGTVEPDPKSDQRIQKKKGSYFIASKSGKIMEL